MEGELRRLQTDYIDLMQIHWPDRCVAQENCAPLTTTHLALSLRRTHPTEFTQRCVARRYLPLFGKSQYQVDMEREEATPFVEQVEAMHDLIKEGKIRHWGLSNESSFGVMRHIAAADMLVSISMLPFSDEHKPQIAAYMARSCTRRGHSA